LLFFFLWTMDSNLYKEYEDAIKVRDSDKFGINGLQVLVEYYSRCWNNKRSELKSRSGYWKYDIQNCFNERVKLLLTTSSRMWQWECVAKLKWKARSLELWIRCRGSEKRGCCKVYTDADHIMTRAVLEKVTKKKKSENLE